MTVSWGHVAKTAKRRIAFVRQPLVIGQTAVAGLATAGDDASVEPFGDEPVRCPVCGLHFVPDRASETRAHRHPVSPSVFRREGEYWLIMFEGDVMRLRDTKGLRCLAALLANPGREMLALQLVSGDNRPGAPSVAGRVRTEDGLRLFMPGDGEDVIDAKARSAFEQRLDDLRAEADEAEQFGDAERLARAEGEIEALVQALRSVVGLGGRTRQMASPAERARQSVTKAIKAAAERIAAESPALARHLASTLRTGTYCVYDPDPRLPVTWRT